MVNTEGSRSAHCILFLSKPQPMNRAFADVFLLAALIGVVLVGHVATGERSPSWRSEFDFQPCSAVSAAAALPVTFTTNSVFSLITALANNLMCW